MLLLLLVVVVVEEGALRSAVVIVPAYSYDKHREATALADKTDKRVKHRKVCLGEGCWGGRFGR